MSNFIVIESNNYDGFIADILFNPSNSDEVINLGEVTLPFTFKPYLLTPPREIYGTYTINVIEPNCTYFINVPQPTPTPTPTSTKTPTPTPKTTQTPTPTTTKLCPTPTMTPTVSHSNTPEPTSSVTPTPTSSLLCPTEKSSLSTNLIKNRNTYKIIID